MPVGVATNQMKIEPSALLAAPDRFPRLTDNAKNVPQVVSVSQKVHANATNVQSEEKPAQIDDRVRFAHPEHFPSEDTTVNHVILEVLPETLVLVNANHAPLVTVIHETQQSAHLVLQVQAHELERFVLLALQDLYPLQVAHASHAQ